MKINRKYIAILFVFLIVLVSTLLLSLNFSGRRPVLDSISLGVAAPGDTITLYGNHFGSGISVGRVYLGDKMIFEEFIKSWSNREIVLKLPDDFKSGMFVVDNLFGKSEPFLITSTNDVPEVKRRSAELSTPVIESGRYIDSSNMKVSLEGKSFSVMDHKSVISLYDSENNRIIPSKNFISSWVDDRIIFYLPYSIDNLLVIVTNSYGSSEIFKVEKRGASPVRYTSEERIRYKLEQSVEIRDVITLGKGVISLYVPCAVNDLNQLNQYLHSQRGKYIDNLNAYKFDLEFSETGERDRVTLSTIVEVGKFTTEVKSNLLALNYDRLSPEYIQGFSFFPGVDSDDKNIINTSAWIVRNISNKFNQVKVLVDWILRYIKIGSEYSDDAVTALTDRSASDIGLINTAVSMLRSVGIPARVVSGIKIGESVENFRWMEFFLPGGGWVPLDLLLFSRDKNYTIGTLDNNLIAFSKGVKKIDYKYDDFHESFYAVQNISSNYQGNIESYETVWHNVEIK